MLRLIFLLMIGIALLTALFTGTGDLSRVAGVLLFLSSLSAGIFVLWLAISRNSWRVRSGWHSEQIPERVNYYRAEGTERNKKVVQESIQD